MDQSFRVACQRAAQHGFVDEIDAEARGVLADGVSNVVAELVFLLVAQNWERGDGGDELIVTESFEAGNGAVGGAEGKGERVAQIAVARLGVMQRAGFEYERAQPTWG